MRAAPIALWLAAMTLNAYALPSQDGKLKKTPATQNKNAQDVEFDLQEFTSEIERLRLRLTIDGGSADIEKRLGEMWSLVKSEVGKSPTCVNARAGMKRIIIGRVEILIDMGKPVEAASFLKSIAEAAGETGVSFSPAESQSIQAAKAMYSSDAEVAVLRKVVETAVASSSVHDGVSAAVTKAVHDRDWGLIHSLGSRSAPALARWVAESLDQFEGNEKDDPLTHLVSIDSEMAADLIDENYDRGGYLWKKRILRICLRDARRRLKVTDSSLGYPPAARYPRWLNIFTRLAFDPEIAKEAFPYVTEPMDAGIAPDALIAGMLDMVASREAEAAKHLVSAFSNPSSQRNVNHEVLRKVFESALDSPFADLRASAAARLRGMDESAALLQHAGDSDARVRRSAAQVVADPLLSSPNLDSEGEYRGGLWVRSVNPVWTPERLAMLARLLRDPEVNVRVAACKGLETLSSALPLADYLEFAADPDVRVRTAVMVGVNNTKSSDMIMRVALALAHEPKTQLLYFIDECVGKQGEKARVEDLLAYYVRRCDHPNPNFVSLNGRFRPFVALNFSAAGFEAHVRLALGYEDGEKRLLEMQLIEQRPLEHFATLSPVLMGPLLHELSKAGYIEDVRNCLKALAKHSNTAQRSAGFESLLQYSLDHDLGQAVQYLILLAAQGFDSPAYVRSTQSFFEIVNTDTIGRDVYNRESKMSLTSLLSEAPAEAANKICLHVINSPGISDDLVDRVAWKYSTTAPLAKEIAQAIFKRWPDMEQASRRASLGKAIAQLGPDSGLPTVDILRLAIRNGGLRNSAVAAISKLRDPQFIPDLGEAIVTSSNGGYNLQTAINCLTAYLSDEAAEELLRVAGLCSKRETRDACLEAIDAIQSFQDARERWAARRVQRNTRDKTISELIGFLDDANSAIQIQAIRALATFEAIETMPLLIMRLKDDNAMIAAAARAALDQMNAAAPATDDGGK